MSVAMDATVIVARQSNTQEKKKTIKSSSPRFRQRYRKDEKECQRAGDVAPWVRAFAVHV